MIRPVLGLENTQGLLLITLGAERCAYVFMLDLASSQYLDLVLIMLRVTRMGT